MKEMSLYIHIPFCKQKCLYCDFPSYSGRESLMDDYIDALSKEILDKINTLISTMPNSIQIEGHTDNVPIRNSQYEDNLELSSARAASVVRYFTNNKNQSAARFSAVGCGDSKPRVENTTEENKAQNRRVNILIVSDMDNGE